MDPLSDALKVAHLTGGVFLDAEFTAPWCLSTQLAPQQRVPFLLNASDLLLYHYVIEGRVLICLSDDKQSSYELGPGDMVLLPRNDMHLMGSDLSLPPVDGGELVQPPQGDGLFSISYGGGGAATRMVCGFLGGHGAEGNPLISSLPKILVLRSEAGGRDNWVRTTFEFAAKEVTESRPGSTNILGRLSELLFVEAVRQFAQSLPNEQTGWLAGLRDPYVSKVLTLIHADPSHPWTVEELGREVGMSRSALAERFNRLIGQSPIQYLINWRLQIAAQKLRNTSATLSQIAFSIGYESEAAFSRAFRKAFGVSPGTWRRNNN